MLIAMCSTRPIMAYSFMGAVFPMMRQPPCCTIKASQIKTCVCVCLSVMLCSASTWHTALSHWCNKMTIQFCLCTFTFVENTLLKSPLLFCLQNTLWSRLNTTVSLRHYAVLVNAAWTVFASLIQSWTQRHICDGDEFKVIRIFVKSSFPRVLCCSMRKIQKRK